MNFSQSLPTFILVLSLLSTPVLAVDQPVKMTIGARTDETSQFPIRVRENITSDPKVYLYLNNNSGKTLTHMKLSETGLFDSLGWESYSALKLWTFSPPDGQKSIYAQFKTTGNEVIGSAATFIFDTTPPDITFSLKTHTVGPNTMDLITFNQGQDTYSHHYFDFRLSLDSSFINIPWQARTSDLINFPINHKYSSYRDGDTLSIFFQARDSVGNTTPVLVDQFIIDKSPPVLYAQVTPSDFFSSDIQILSYDQFSELGKMELSNDPMFLTNVKLFPTYQPNLHWSFDNSRVVWIKIWDSVGNVTEPHPFYLSRINTPTPPSDSSVTPTPIITTTNTPSANPTIFNDPKYKEFQEKIANLEKQNIQIKENIQEQSQKLSILENIINTILSFIKSIFPSWSH